MNQLIVVLNDILLLSYV